MLNNKKDFINQIFSSVANNYDIMNDIMSFGIHRLWKAKLIEQIVNVNSAAKLLDVAGGTGDIAIRAINKHKNIDATICDINYNMLNIGRDNAINLNKIKIKWICADAENLPFPTDFFDYYTIAFGIRNVSNRQKALDEAYRVLKPEGKFICLEFSSQHKGQNLLFKTLYDFYSFNIIPRIGHFITKDKAAYEYLVSSIRKFPIETEFISEIKDSGFSFINYKNLTKNIVALYTAYKI